MKQKRFICTTLVCLFLSSLLTACGKSISKIEKEKDFSVYGDISLGTSEFSKEYSICESGIFYLGNNQMKYYDFEEKESYVLCGNPDCSHNSEECSAWYENIGGVSGLGCYEDNLYAFLSEETQYELIKMNLTGENRQTIAVLDKGNYQSGQWIINHIGEGIFYCNGMVWLTLNKEYVEDEQKHILSDMQSQCIGINLSSGEITYLNEVDEKIKNSRRYSINAVSPEKVVLQMEEFEDNLLSEEEFYDAYEKGNFEEEIFRLADDPYDAYCNTWYTSNAAEYVEYICYDVDKKQSVSLERMKEKDIIENGEKVGQIPPLGIIGWYDGNLVCETYNDNRNNDFFLWNTDTKEKTNLFHINNGGALIVKMSDGVVECISNGNQILYCEYLPDDMAQIYKYDIESQQSIPLFKDKRQISFRIENETEDRYIGRVDEGKTYCWIWKADYEKGELDKIHKIYI